MKKNKPIVEYIDKKEWDELVAMGALVENDTIVSYSCDEKGIQTGEEVLLRCK